MPQKQIVIGRQPGRDIVLSLDTAVSRTHAQIDFESGNYVVSDAGSSNGTFVNGQRITRHNLAPGDVIQVGATKFRFEG